MMPLWCIYDTPMVLIWCTSHALMMLLWYMYVAPLLPLWYPYYALMMLLWCVYGAPIALLWCAYDTPRVLLWCTYHAPLRLLWCIYDAPMMPLWCSCDAPADAILSNGYCDIVSCVNVKILYQAVAHYDSLFNPPGSGFFLSFLFDQTQNKDRVDVVNRNLIKKQTNKKESLKASLSELEFRVRTLSETSLSLQLNTHSTSRSRKLSLPQNDAHVAFCLLFLHRALLCFDSVSFLQFLPTLHASTKTDTWAESSFVSVNKPRLIAADPCR